MFRKKYVFLNIPIVTLNLILRSILIGIEKIKILITRTSCAIRLIYIEVVYKSAVLIYMLRANGSKLI